MGGAKFINMLFPRSKARRMLLTGERVPGPELYRLGVVEACVLAERAHYVEHATMADQKVLAFTDIEQARAPYFSMVLIHRRGEAWR